MKPDFSKYSLALIKDDKIVYSSGWPGLRPLVDCISKCKDEYSDCTLFDKAIGLAAAKLIVYSGMISAIQTKVASKSAIEFLKQQGIEIKTELKVNFILNNDKTGPCHMEIKAEKATSPEALYLELKELFR